MNTEEELEIKELIEEMKACVRELCTRKQDLKNDIDRIESKIEKLNERIISKMNNE